MVNSRDIIRKQKIFRSLSQKQGKRNIFVKHLSVVAVLLIAVLPINYFLSLVGIPHVFLFYLRAFCYAIVVLNIVGAFIVNGSKNEERLNGKRPLGSVPIWNSSKSPSLKRKDIREQPELHPQPSSYSIYLQPFLVSGRQNFDSTVSATASNDKVANGFGIIRLYANTMPSVLCTADSTLMSPMLHQTSSGSISPPVSMIQNLLCRGHCYPPFPLTKDAITRLAINPALIDLWIEKARKIIISHMKSSILRLDGAVNEISKVFEASKIFDKETVMSLTRLLSFQTSREKLSGLVALSLGLKDDTVLVKSAQDVASVVLEGIGLASLFEEYRVAAENLNYCCSHRTAVAGDISVSSEGAHQLRGMLVVGAGGKGHHRHRVDEPSYVAVADADVILGTFFHLCDMLSGFRLRAAAYADAVSDIPTPVYLNSSSESEDTQSSIASSADHHREVIQVGIVRSEEGITKNTSSPHFDLFVTHNMILYSAHSDRSLSYDDMSSSSASSAAAANKPWNEVLVVPEGRQNSYESIVLLLIALIKWRSPLVCRHRRLQTLLVDLFQTEDWPALLEFLSNEGETS